MCRNTARFEPMPLPPLAASALASVVIPNYNYAQFIGMALESVLKQTYGRFEAIVCDDGSTDNSREVIGEYVKRDSRIRLLTQSNRGFTAAVNKAYAASAGELILLLDADDQFDPAKLETVLATFRDNPRSGVCIHPVLPVSKDGQPLGPAYPANVDQGWIGPEKLKQGGCNVLPPTSGLSFRREVTAKLFPIPSAVTRPVDYYLSATAAFLTEVSFTPRSLAAYRIHGANMSKVPGSDFRPSFSSFDVRILTKCIEDLEEVLPVQKAFLTELYGPSVGATLRLEDHPGYWDVLLGVRALVGRRAGTGRPYSVREMIRHVQRPANRRLWRAITLLPDPLAKRAYCLWRGSSPLKRITKRILLPLVRG